MADIEHLLQQTCDIYTAGVVDKFGKRTFGGATTVDCRFQKTTRTIATKQNEVEPIDGIVFLAQDTTITVGDKLRFSSADYRVMKIEPLIDDLGDTSHLEVMVQEWSL